MCTVWHSASMSARVRGKTECCAEDTEFEGKTPPFYFYVLHSPVPPQYGRHHARDMMGEVHEPGTGTQYRQLHSEHRASPTTNKEPTLYQKY